MKAVERTRGGLNTKIHTVVDALGYPLQFMLTAGNVNNSVVAVDLLSCIDKCLFQKLKWFRRVATRYNKLDSVFLACVYLAAISILLK